MQGLYFIDNFYSVSCIASAWAILAKVADAVCSTLVRMTQSFRITVPSSPQCDSSFLLLTLQGFTRYYWSVLILPKPL